MILGRIGEQLAAAAASGMPPAPLERTRAAPWVWLSAQPRRARLDPAELIARIPADPALAEVTVRPGPDGFVEVVLSEAAVNAALREIAAGWPAESAQAAEHQGPSQMPKPQAGADLRRFEAARRSGGAPALPAHLSGRRVLDNPVVAVQLAHARAVRHARGTPVADHLPVTTGTRLDPTTGSTLDPRTGATLEPTTAALVTELLDAPRRLARLAERPHEVTGALVAVATAYLAWEQPQPPTDDLLSRAARAVLVRGTALLGVHAPVRM